MSSCRAWPSRPWLEWGHKGEEEEEEESGRSVLESHLSSFFEELEAERGTERAASWEQLGLIQQHYPAVVGVFLTLQPTRLGTPGLENAMESQGWRTCAFRFGDGSFEWRGPEH